MRSDRFEVDKPLLKEIVHVSVPSILVTNQTKNDEHLLKLKRNVYQAHSLVEKNNQGCQKDEVNFENRFFICTIVPRYLVSNKTRTEALSIEFQKENSSERRPTQCRRIVK